MRLIIHPDASLDIQEEAHYYEDKQPALGLAFVEEVDSAIENILSMPLAFPERSADIRIFIMSRFPFCILYRQHSDDLEILVVRHQARHPDFGMDRT